MIEKVTMQTPFQNEIVFEKEGCLLYFKNVRTKLFSAEDDLTVGSHEAILLRCGAYFFD